MQLALENFEGDSPDIPAVSFFLLEENRPALKLDALETGEPRSVNGEFLLYVLPGELSAVPKDRLLNGYCLLVAVVGS